MNNTGYFLFSLDTELGTGYFDEDAARHRLFSKDGIEERKRIARVLTLCEQYGIHATWAVVGHLFFNRCEYCPDCPISHWQGRATMPVITKLTALTILSGMVMMWCD